MKTILITGINGFLGSNLAKTLSSEYKIIGLEYNLENLFRVEASNFKIYSVKNGISDSIFNEHRIDTIIHTATQYGRHSEGVYSVAKTNLLFPIELVEKAIKSHVINFINADTVLDRFLNSYTLTKCQFREWLFLMQNEIKTINLRLEHFYGPGSNDTNFISKMIRKLGNNEAEIELTKGDQKRDFIYIDDVISAFHFVLQKSPHFLNNFIDLHVETNQPISIKELLVSIKKMTKSNSILNFGAVPNKNEINRASLDKIPSIRSLGWLPRIKLEDGLQKTIACS